jgi:hypothetical protein
MNMAKTWRNGAIVGLVCALIEAVLIVAGDPDAGQWALTQGVLFWFGCGLVVYMADSGLPPVAHGIALTVLLNVPWYIALSVVPGKPSLLGPLVIASVVLGGVIGALKRKLNKAR